MQVFLIEKVDESRGSLNSEETRHCQKVLRHQVGDEINGIDGHGHYVRARIEAFTDGNTQLTLMETIPEWGEHGGRLCLAVSPLRLKDRFEWLIEKAVELGVTDIVPLVCARTDLYKSKFKVPRLETIMLTATKQCLRSRIPHLHPRISFTEWLTAPIGQGLIAHCEEAHSRQSLTDLLTSSSVKQLTLMIGPEGDFTPEEVNAATQCGYFPIALGRNRLRTETAAIHALSLIKGNWGY